MNLVSHHHFAVMPGAHPAAGQSPVSQVEPKTVQSPSSADAPASTSTERSQKAQHELRLEAQLRVKEAQEQRVIDNQIQTLAARDREVRTHEQAHVAAGGQYAGAPVYQFERGPNGLSYAVGGEVPISTGAEATPEATLRKAQIIRRAALAPAEPSSQDRAVAAMASRLEGSARLEITMTRTREKEEPTDTGVQDIAADAMPASPATKEADSPSTGSANRQEDTDRLQRKLFTHDKMASASPGTLFSHMA
jgi:hypothetical protein